MRSLLLAGVAAASLVMPLGSWAAAQGLPQVQPVQVDPSRPDWENPAVNSRNKLPAHATGFPYETRALAVAGEEARSSRYVALDGTWKFAL